MSHTLKVIAGGLVLLGLFLLGGRLLSASAPALGMAGAVRWFIPVWLVAAAVNMWIGVTRAGYSVGEELPIDSVAVDAGPGIGEHGLAVSDE